MLEPLFSALARAEGRIEHRKTDGYMDINARADLVYGCALAMVLKPSAALAQQLDVLRSLDIGRSEGRVAIAVHLRYGDESFKVSFFNSKIK